jgi:hypothetical protein
MRESAGKKVERTIFFNECLPSWFLPEQLQAGNFLLLLGRNPEELRFTDKLSVDRSHVWSVEEKLDVYREQDAGDLGVSLYYGSMSEYLENLLHGNQAFLVLRLDVEGSYLTQIDPAMSSVLLFCWRNPETVIASYASIGRDSETLWEGAKSLAWFLGFVPDEVTEFFHSYAARYKEAGFIHPTRMVLRDIFWLRSLMEHDIVASAAVGVVKPWQAQKVLGTLGSVWDGVLGSKKLPLTMSRLKEAARGALSDRSELLATRCLGLEMSAAKHVIYKAEPPWSQRCYFTKWRICDAMTDCVSWARNAFASLVGQPLTYVDRDGTRIEFHHNIKDAGSPNPVVWRDGRIWREFHPRGMSVRPSSSYLALPKWTIESIKNHAASVPGHTASNGSRPEKTDPPIHVVVEGKENMTSNPEKHFTRDGSLTDYGKSQIRRMAQSGMTTEEIQAVVPKSVSRQSIVAHVAVAHRKKKR